MSRSDAEVGASGTPLLPNGHSDSLANFEYCSICDAWIEAATRNQHNAEKAEVHAALGAIRLKESKSWGCCLTSLVVVVLALVLYVALREELKTEIEEEVFQAKQTLEERETESDNEFSQLGAKMKEWETESDEKFSQLGAKMKEALAHQAEGSTFEWEIKDPAEIKAVHSGVGDHFLSPHFFLRGLGPFALYVFPSGQSKDPRGIVVFLKSLNSLPSVKVQYRLTVNGQSTELTECVFDDTSVEHWAPWMHKGPTWPETDSKPVHITVEFLKVTHIATTK